MSNSPIVIPKVLYPPKLGEILQEAELITAAQVEVALHNQNQRLGMLLGEILALHGWIKQDTADFFVDQWPRLVNQTDRKRLGDYLQAAALLEEEQINAILKEQWQTGVKFGSLVVLRGWLKPATIDFFLTYLFPHQLSEGPLISRRSFEQQTSDAMGHSYANRILAQTELFPDKDIRWID